MHADISQAHINAALWWYKSFLMEMMPYAGVRHEKHMLMSVMKHKNADEQPVVASPVAVCQKPCLCLRHSSQCLSLLQNVTPKDESVFDEKVSSKDTLPSHTLGLFKHEFGTDGKMKDTWFIRQFSKDEAARKVRLSGLHSQNVIFLFVVVVVKYREYSI